MISAEVSCNQDLRVGHMQFAAILEHTSAYFLSLHHSTNCIKYTRNIFVCIGYVHQKMYELSAPVVSLATMLLLCGIWDCFEGCEQFPIPQGCGGL